MYMWIGIIFFSFFCLFFLGLGLEKENNILILLGIVNLLLTIIIFVGICSSNNITNDKSIIEKHPITQIKTLQKDSQYKCIVYCENDKEYELDSLSKNMKECSEDEPYYEDYYRDYYVHFWFFKYKVKDKYPIRTFYIPKDIYNSIKYNGSTVTYYNYDTKEE